MITTPQRYLAGAMALTIVALLSWLTISPGWPRIYAPFNLLVMLPYLWSSSDILAVAVVPLFFAIWSWPVLHGDPALPTRSVVLLIFGVVLSAAWLLIGYRYGIQYAPFTWSASPSSILCVGRYSVYLRFSRAVGPRSSTTLAFTPHCLPGSRGVPFHIWASCYEPRTA